MKNINRDKLLQETIALLSADLFEYIYSPDNGIGFSETAAEIISLAEKFEQELNWQGPDNETRDYILELDKFENKILKEKGTDLSRLTKIQESCRNRLEYAILQFVKENGDDLTDYDINEFGLDEGREGEETITKVWNFFDNGGCYFIETVLGKEFDIQSVRNNHAGKDGWEIDEAVDEEIENSFNFYAYQCLYIVVDENKNERLKYYRFYNCGACFDDEGSEPDHDYVSKLSLADLCFLVEAIRQNPEQSN